MDVSSSSSRRLLYYSVSGPLIAAFTAVTTLIAKAAAMHSGLRGDVNSVDVFLM